LYYIS